MKINEKIRARQKSEIAIVVFFEGTKSGRWEWCPKTKPSNWSEPFKTQEQAVQNAIDHGYHLVFDENRKILVKK